MVMKACSVQGPGTTQHFPPFLSPSRCTQAKLLLDTCGDCLASLVTFGIVWRSLATGSGRACQNFRYCASTAGRNLVTLACASLAVSCQRVYEFRVLLAACFTGALCPQHGGDRGMDEECISRASPHFILSIPLRSPCQVQLSGTGISFGGLAIHKKQPIICTL